MTDLPTVPAAPRRGGGPRRRPRQPRPRLSGTDRIVAHR